MWTCCWKGWVIYWPQMPVLRLRMLSTLCLGPHCPGLPGFCAWNRVQGAVENYWVRDHLWKFMKIEGGSWWTKNLLLNPSSARARGIDNWSASPQLLGWSQSKSSWKQRMVTWRRMWWLEIARMDLLRVNCIWLSCLPSLIKWLDLWTRVEQRMFSLTGVSLWTQSPRLSLYPSWDHRIQNILI